MAVDLSRLYSNRKSFTFKWILENFDYCGLQEGQLLESPAFIVETMERSKWCVSICPRFKNESETWIALYLNRVKDSKGPTIVKVGFELAFLAVDGSVLKPNRSNAVSFSKNSGLGFHNIVERKSLFAQRSTYMPGGALTIQCRMWKTENVSNHGQCIARTRIGIERKTFHWKIENFSILDIGEETSFKLKTTSNDNKIMLLKLFLRKNFCSNDIFIKFSDSDQSIVFSTFKSSIVTALRNYMDCVTHDILFPLSVQNGECKLSLSKNRLMEDKSVYLPNDVLTLYCELAFSTGVVFEGIEDASDACSSSIITNNIKTASNESCKHPDLKMDIRSMLQNNVLCNVKLCVESQNFPAHWFILIARSPVFRAMFESDMKEKIKSQIHITDLKPETVRRMLHYMYTDTLEELDWEAASDLFVAADKYLIMTLKDKCCLFLMNNLTIKNACKILLLSDVLQDKGLKSSVQNFILENSKIIINSNEWKSLMEANVNLALETMLLGYK